MSDNQQSKKIGAVILAAGLGERLRDHGRPKPLSQVAGMTLLERAVRTLRVAGVSGCMVVVVGHRGDEVSEFIRARKLDVRVVENPSYARGNGTSVLAALPYLPERFVVAMVDHVHSPASVEALLEGSGDFVAAIDTRPAFADPDEATRVRIRGTSVIEFGKGMEPYDGLDTGLFMCSRPALEQIRMDPQGTLSWNTFKRTWLKSGRDIAACDLSGAPWIDVDSSQELKRAPEAVVAWAASGNDGFVSRHVNRRLSRRITRLLLHTPVTANQVSLLSFVVASAGAGLLARGAWAYGGLLVQVSSVLDGCDGEIARARLESSPKGGVLDATLDRWADALIVSGMALGARSRHATLAAYPALTGALLVPYTRAKLESAFGKVPERLTRFGATRDMRLAALALGALLHKPTPTLLAVGLAANAEVARRLVNLRRPDEPRERGCNEAQGVESYARPANGAGWSGRGSEVRRMCQHG